jgi:hypothetical protein
MQACAGLRVWLAEILCMWITGLAGCRAQAGGVEIVQACAGLRVWQSGMEIVLMWITILAGIRGRARSRDRAGLRGGSLA